MKLKEEEINAILEAARDIASEHVHDNWEGTGYSCFDPFGDFKKEFKLKLEELNATKPHE